MQGYIKLYRKLMDNPIWSDPHYLKLWIYCLLKATHKERKVIIGNKTVTLYPGQFITGRKTLADDLNEGMKPKQQLSESTWWRYLNNLEDWGMLNIKKTNKYSVISIVKWYEYQETEQQMNIKKTSSSEGLNLNSIEIEHQINNRNPCVSMDSENNNNETEHQMNIKWTSNEQQMNTNKNVKNVKNDNIYTIFKYWNSKEIIVHRQLNEKMKSHINARLKEYSVEELMKAIDNYNKILKSDKYYWTYKWTLQDFMKPNNVVRFMDQSEPFKVYLSKKFKIDGLGRPDLPPKREIDFSEGEDWY